MEEKLKREALVKIDHERILKRNGFIGKKLSKTKEQMEGLQREFEIDPNWDH